MIIRTLCEDWHRQNYVRQQAADRCRKGHRLPPKRSSTSTARLTTIPGFLNFLHAYLASNNKPVYKNPVPVLLGNRSMAKGIRRIACPIMQWRGTSHP
jgi:hypothetical protein